MSTKLRDMFRELNGNFSWETIGTFFKTWTRMPSESKELVKSLGSMYAGSLSGLLSGKNVVMFLGKGMVSILGTVYRRAAFYPLILAGAAALGYKLSPRFKMYVESLSIYDMYQAAVMVVGNMLRRAQELYDDKSVKKVPRDVYEAIKKFTKSISLRKVAKQIRETVSHNMQKLREPRKTISSRSVYIDTSQPDGEGETGEGNYVEFNEEETGEGVEEKKK